MASCWKKLFVVLGCLVLVGAAAWWLRVYREPVLLVEKVSFGMLPAEVEQALGAPFRDETIRYEVSDAAFRYQDYEAELLGRPALISCEFIRYRMRWVLWKCTIRFPDMPDSEAWRQQVTALLTAQLEGQERFFCHEYGASIVDIGVNRGPVGTSYMVTLDDGKVSILCHCDEYIR